MQKVDENTVQEEFSAKGRNQRYLQRYINKAYQGQFRARNTTDLVFSPLIIPGVSTIEIPFSTWKMQIIDLRERP